MNIFFPDKLLNNTRFRLFIHIPEMNMSKKHRPKM